MRTTQDKLVSAAFLLVSCLALAFAIALHDLIHDRFFADNIFSQGLDAVLLAISFLAMHIHLDLCKGEWI